MTTPDREMPAANRTDSEIDFVLRRAKWRRGPEMLRDLARAQAAAKGDSPIRAPAKREAPRKRSPGRASI